MIEKKIAPLSLMVVQSVEPLSCGRELKGSVWFAWEGKKQSSVREKRDF